MRVHAYQLPSDLYRELEPQILEQLRDASREQLLYLVGEADLEIELLGGEWRLLFAELADYYQHVDIGERRARLAVSPDELADFVELLREPERQQRWSPVSFGLAELTNALPQGVDLVGLLFVEESDDWMWIEHPYEMQMIRPEVYALLEPHMRDLIQREEHMVLARLCGDHAEAAIEFKPGQWEELLGQASEQVPELVPVIEATLVDPRDYSPVREALSLLSNPQLQPSLDAWLRVHASTAGDYALYFRDIAKERG